MQDAVCEWLVMLSFVYVSNLQWASICGKPHQTHAVYTLFCSTYEQHQGSHTTLSQGEKGEFNDKAEKVSLTVLLN